MADTTTNRSESSKESRQELAKRQREQGAAERRELAGGWLSNPFQLMDRMSEEMDRTFDRMFREFGMPRRAWFSRNPFRSIEREGGLWAPRVEAFQKGDRFIVRADLPGLKKDDVQIDVNDDTITIHGERRAEHEEQREGYYHSEREVRQFHRTVPLPGGVIADSAEASFKDGVLEISMQAPPAEATRGRRLEIKDTSQAGEKK